MDKSICSVDGCENKIRARGFCKRHYGRYSKGLPITKACLSCGNDYFRQGSYCSDECRPECAHEWCRNKVNGQEYCNSHVGNMRRSGKMPVRQWADARLCVVCGKAEWPPNGLRRYCSQACAKLHRLNGYEQLETCKKCTRCGHEIDLTFRHPSGYKRKSSAFLCERCKRARRTYHGMSVNILRNRDGSKCKICGLDIDFDLIFPNQLSPSVDHIKPYSLGGSNDLENLQLAHLRCNSIKSNRENFTLYPYS